MIEHYTFGSIQIQGQVYQDDVLLCGSKVVSPWWRKRGHSVEVADLQAALEEEPSVLVLGKGKPGKMQASSELRRFLEEHRIELIEKPSEEAVASFNRLVEQGEKVCGGFHLTC